MSPPLFELQSSENACFMLTVGSCFAELVIWWWTTLGRTPSIDIYSQRHVMISTAKLPRFLNLRPRIYRDFCNFDREITAIFSILPCRGTAIFGFKNRDKLLPL